MWGDDFLLIGYEANPTVMNKYKDYPGHAINQAIYSDERELELHWRKKHRDGSSFFIEDGEASMMVKTKSLDQLHQNKPAAGEHVLFWLDCEGAELEVLHGAEQFIKGVEMVNIEMTSKPRGSQWCDHVDVHDWLTSHGFVRQWVHTQRQSIGQVDGLYVRPWMWKEEYCCCPMTVARMRLTG
jgi:FkbM family methyltransferase